MQLRSLRRVLPLAWVLLGVVAFFAGADAQAAAEEKRFGQEVLEILRDEGKIDDERYEELRKLEQAEHEAAQQPGSANPEAFSVTYKNGLNFNRNGVRLCGWDNSDWREYVEEESRGFRVPR